MLKDKVAIITGGGAGIGREIALTFAREGCNIAVCDIVEESASKTAAEIRNMGRKAECFVVDVSSMDEVEATVYKTVDKFDGINILVNNAGITRDGLLLRMSESEWEAGIIGFTKSVARELAGRGITANAIAPGFINTRMTDVLNESQKKALVDRIPLKRLGETHDVANAALFLASDMAGYITGQVIVVDGGMVM